MWQGLRIVAQTLNPFSNVEAAMPGVVSRGSFSGVRAVDMIFAVRMSDGGMLKARERA
jgi:hypothetical protein